MNQLRRQYEAERLEIDQILLSGNEVNGSCRSSVSNMGGIMGDHEAANLVKDFKTFYQQILVGRYEETCD